MRWINRRPGRPLGLLLAAAPFVAVALAYAAASAIRRAENPADRLLPAPEAIVATAIRLVSEPDRRSGGILFWADTLASLERLALGVGIAALLGLALGLLIGLLPMVRAGLGGFVAAVSMVPPLALLPILFIVAGLG